MVACITQSENWVEPIYFLCAIWEVTFAGKEVSNKSFLDCFLKVKSTDYKPIVSELFIYYFRSLRQCNNPSSTYNKFIPSREKPLKILSLFYRPTPTIPNSVNLFRRAVGRYFSRLFFEILTVYYFAHGLWTESATQPTPFPYSRQGGPLGYVTLFLVLLSSCCCFTSVPGSLWRRKMQLLLQLNDAAVNSSSFFVLISLFRQVIFLISKKALRRIRY